MWRANAAAGYGMVGRIWLILTGPVTVIILADCFTPVMQGYFFTFISLAAARILAELGLGQAIIVEVTRSLHGSASRDIAPPKFVGLVRFSAKWFAGAGCFAALLLGAIGTTVLSTRGGLASFEWLPAWLATSAMIAVDLALSGLMFPLEGAGSVKQVYFCRMVRNIINAAMLWFGLLAGLQLWSIPLALAASAAWTVNFLLSKEARFVSRAAAVPGCRHPLRRGPDLAHQPYHRLVSACPWGRSLAARYAWGGGSDDYR